MNELASPVGFGELVVHSDLLGDLRLSTNDVIAFERDPTHAGSPGGIAHFGFRLTTPDDIDAAVREVEEARGKILRRGEFGPGSPYVFVQDPDGCEIEIWYE